MGDLSGKVALVTGAGRKRGIGRAIALRLAGDGADVVVSGSPRDPSSFPEHERAAGWKGIESVAEEIRALGRRAFAIDCDVAVKPQVKQMVARAVATLGGIDILVNNAALPSEAGRAPIVEMDDENWYRTVDVNLNGLYLVTKFAMLGLTQQLALELAKHGILVNCVCPGSTDTDMMDGTFRRTAERWGLPAGAPKEGTIHRIPLGRQGRPEDQAAVVAFLASEDSAYMTGQTINVDGGIRMD